jgi:hypothetical protein
MHYISSGISMKDFQFKGKASSSFRENIQLFKKMKLFSPFIIFGDHFGFPGLGFAGYWTVIIVSTSDPFVHKLNVFCTITMQR